MENNRVCCLYRVSTDKQVYYDNNNEADIPMQRKACHRFADKMGWTIVHEEQEDGVSCHKIRAENRDKIQARLFPFRSPFEICSSRRLRYPSSPPIKYWMNTYFFSGGFAVKVMI